MTDLPAIDVLLEHARSGLDRVQPERLAEEPAGGAILIDIRPMEQRQRDGDLPGAIVIDRNVLEARLDPTSPHRLPIATDTDVRFIIACNEGYSSSLAAATLQELGIRLATDLVGASRPGARSNPDSRRGSPPPIPRSRDLPARVRSPAGAFACCIHPDPTATGAVG